MIEQDLPRPVARAIEAVNAGDTEVGVRHFTNPRLLPCFRYSEGGRAGAARRL
jgi:hypothetical protein